MTVVVVDGSPGAPHVSRSWRLAQDAAGRARDRDVGVTVHRVIDLDLVRLAGRDLSDARLQQITGEVGRAGAVIVVSPVYQASFSGLLKLWLDLLPPGGLSGKAILMLSTAGSAVHACVLGYALTPVVLSLGAQTLVPSWCALACHWDRRARPEVRLTPHGARRLEERVDVLLGHLREPVPVLAGAPARAPDAGGPAPATWPGLSDQDAGPGGWPPLPTPAVGRRSAAAAGPR